jgi:hypothetical protein
MAHGKTLELREIRPHPVVVEGTECSLKTKEVDGVVLITGRKTCMPYVGASRDRSLPGKARIRARRVARKAGA